MPFGDRLEESLSELKGTPSIGSRVDVPKDRQYTGFDAYKQVIDQVDLVLLTTPPHFRPLHLAYAVEKGINAFVEKPMAVDGPGLRKYIQACKDAKAKNLSLVNGFCWRYDGPRRETMKQVFDGKIGDIDRHRDDLQLARRLGAAQDSRRVQLRHGIPDAQLVLLLMALGRPHRRAGRAWHRHHGLGHGRQAARPMLGRRRPPVPH